MSKDKTELLELLRSTQPAALLTGWHASGKLAALLPEVARLFGTPQRPEYHPEVDCGIHVALCLDMAHRLNASEPARFAVLMHDLGKALTPVDMLPRHLGHEARGLAPVKQVCDRLQVPPYWRHLAMLVCEYHLHAHRAFEMRARSVLEFLSQTGLEADPALLEDFLLACEADSRGRLGKQDSAYPQGQFIRHVAQALQDLPVIAAGPISGRAAQAHHGQRLHAVRLAALPFLASHDDDAVSQHQPPAELAEPAGPHP